MDSSLKKSLLWPGDVRMNPLFIHSAPSMVLAVCPKHARQSVTAIAASDNSSTSLGVHFLLCLANNSQLRRIFGGFSRQVYVWFIGLG